MPVQIEESWKEILTNEFEKEYWQNLTAFVKKEYATTRCYPPASLIFNAFDSCPLGHLKVVIIGQDPYHGPGQAHGLCFSVNDGIPFPPSLLNIFKELQDDVGKPLPKSGNLQHWAGQGVLLLNATLTVRAAQAGSHQGKGWERFTDSVIEAINRETQGVVFMLWGSYAQKKGQYIDQSKHLVLKAVHPSPLAANRGGWFGQKLFSKCNKYLQSKGKEPIQW